MRKTFFCIFTLILTALLFSACGSGLQENHSIEISLSPFFEKLASASLKNDSSTLPDPADDTDSASLDQEDGTQYQVVFWVTGEAPDDFIESIGEEYTSVVQEGLQQAMADGTATEFLADTLGARLWKAGTAKELQEQTFRIRGLKIGQQIYLVSVILYELYPAWYAASELVTVHPGQNSVHLSYSTPYWLTDDDGTGGTDSGDTSGGSGSGTSDPVTEDFMTLTALQAADQPSGILIKLTKGESWPFTEADDCTIREQSTGIIIEVRDEDFSGDEATYYFPFTSPGTEYTFVLEKRDGCLSGQDYEQKSMTASGGLGSDFIKNDYRTLVPALNLTANAGTGIAHLGFMLSQARMTEMSASIAAGDYSSLDLGLLVDLSGVVSYGMSMLLTDAWFQLDYAYGESDGSHTLYGGGTELHLGIEGSYQMTAGIDFWKKDVEGGTDDHVTVQNPWQEFFNNTLVGNPSVNLATAAEYGNRGFAWVSFKMKLTIGGKEEIVSLPPVTGGSTAIGG